MSARLTPIERPHRAETMAAEAHATRRPLDNHPREMSREDILALHRAAF